MSSALFVEDGEGVLPRRRIPTPCSLPVSADLEVPTAQIGDSANLLGCHSVSIGRDRNGPGPIHADGRFQEVIEWVARELTRTSNPGWQMGT
jgi:hypothetical protein